MMQSSLIPSTVGLIDFFIKNAPNTSWYSNWYLGNPYHFLIGPIIPFAFLIIHRIIPSLNSLNLYIIFIYLSYILGALGLYKLLLVLKIGKRVALLSFLSYLLLPFFTYLLKYQTGLNHIAFSGVPFLLILYKRFIDRGENKTAILISILISILLLISINILLTITISVVCLFIAFRNKKNQQEIIVKTIIIFLLALSIASFWYTPRFFYYLLANPSFGGVPLFNLILNVFKFLINFLPIIFAVILVKWRHYKPKNYVLFSLLFFSSFFVLSIFRFLSDPDFMIDWIGFLLEIQFGFAMLIGLSISHFFKKTKSLFLVFSLSVLFLFINSYLFLSIFNCSKILTFNNCKNNYQSLISSTIKNNVDKNKRIFLSGSSVFFINLMIDVNQVRGVSDNTSIHPYWAHAAYQIREGSSKSLVKNWLIVLGTSYILVNDSSSKEIFRDFKNLDRFKQFNLIFSKDGNFLYKTEKASIARIADKKLLSVSAPKNGADNISLGKYVSALKRPVNFKTLNNQELIIKDNFLDKEVLSLAISYDPGFYLVSKTGTITSDSLGNMVIIPKKTGINEFYLRYKVPFYNYLISIFGVIISLSLLIFYPLFSSKVIAKLNLGIGLSDEEDY